MMTVVAAYLVPGSPLPLLRPDVKPWKPLIEGFRAAGKALLETKPDAVLIYSTQWMAVLDQLWQTRKKLSGLHVDENWHALGNLHFDITVDTELAQACVAATGKVGVRSRAVDYDSFPVDSGTITALNLLGLPAGLPVVLASNNLYHDHATTEKLGAVAAEAASALGRRVAVLGVGGLSGSIIREEIDFADDHIARPEDDAWNKKMLAILEKGDIAAVREALPQFAREARADMGFKHLSWILGALGGSYKTAKTLAYGPLYGSGGAIVEFKP